MLRTCFLLLLILLVSPLSGQSGDSLAVSPEYYLDAGNEAYSAGRIGAAILAYERGLRLRPGHADLINNLTYVRREAGVDQQRLPEWFGLRWWRRAGALVGATTAFVLAQCCWWLAAGLGGFWWLRRMALSEKRRFVLLPLAVTSLLLAVLFYQLGRSRNDFLRMATEAVLTEREVPLRIAPSAESTVDGSLREGTKLRIVDERGSYRKVQREDGRQGWVPASALEII